MKYVELLQPNGTNSTIFTSCCQVAICDDEAKCPHCREDVIGADAETKYQRGRIRWNYATAHWDRRKLYK